jgi:ketosteroid isomerase-like protein
MSEETVQAVADAIAAFDEGGVEAALAYADPEIDWIAPPEWLEDRLYKGHDGLRRLAEFWTQQFDEYRLAPERFIDLDDDRVIALIHQTGKIKGSETPIELSLGWIAQVRDGKLTKVNVYFSWEAALEAAEQDG